MTHAELQESAGTVHSDQIALRGHVAEADGCLLVYDAANKDSLAGFRQLYETIHKSLHIGDRRKPVVVVANKVDLVREKEDIALKEGIDFAKTIDSVLIKASATDAIGFDDMLIEIVSRVVLAWISTGKQPS